MYETLEQILPPEVAMNIMMYTQHPIAEALTPLITKHLGKMVKRREVFERMHRPELCKHEGFALHFFLDKKLIEAAREGKNAKEFKAAHSALVKLYYG